MYRLRFLTLLFTCITAAVCLSDTAQAQQGLSLSDGTGNFITGTPPATSTTVTLSAAAGTTTLATYSLSSLQATTVQATVQTVNGNLPTWLRIGNGAQQPTTSFIGNTGPGATNNLIISANASGLSQATYNGSFIIQIPGNAVHVITVNVQFTVTGGSIVSANPSSLSFTALQGSSLASPSSTNVQISTSIGQPVSFTVSPASQVGNWLLATPTTGNTSTANTFSVFTNPSGLSAGTYIGTVTVAYLNPNTAIQESIAISVTLTVSGGSSITVTPANPPPFLYQVGAATPASQTLTVNSTTTTSFSVAVSSGAFWLVPGLLSGNVGPNSPAGIPVGVNTSGLFTGTYTAQLTISPSNGNPVNVPYKLVVSNNPLLQVSTNTLSFSAPFAGQNPADQTFNVSTTGVGNAVGFSTTTDQTWLTATASQNFVSSGSPAVVTIHANQGSLAVGTYTGTVVIRPTNGDDYQQVVAVTLAVGTTSQVSAGPPVLLFSFQQNRTQPGAQLVSIQTTGQQTTFQLGASTSTCGSGWLLVSPSSNTTPATLSVNVNVGSLPVGTCNGSISVTPATGNALEIPVTVIVSAAAPLLNISQPAGFGFETVQAGSGNVITKFLSMTSTDFSQQVSFGVTSNQSWLSVSGGSTTPSSIAVSINPSSLQPGIYTGQIIINSPGLLTPNSTYTIPVTVVVNPNVTVSVSPSALDFSMNQGGTVPASKTLSFSTSGGSPTFTATINQACTSLLSVSPASGLATGSITVSVQANNASQGTYNCSITLAFQNSANTSATIPVTLTINSARLINVPTTPLSFSYQLTQAAPAPKTLSITSSGGAVQFTVGTSSTPTGWLTSDTSTANTPKDVLIGVNTAGLAVGNYTGTVTVSAPGVLTAPVNISVTLAVTAAPNPQPLTITSSASNLAGDIAPGALITIKGSLLGPATPPNGTLFSINASGGVNSTLAGTRVLFDGIPGTPIYVSATQVNVIAPFELAGRLVTNVVVEYQGISSTPIQVRVTNVAPAIFTQNQQGFGAAAIANQNGTINGPGGNTLPAPINSVVAVYLTGCGQTNPASSTGSVSPNNILLRVPPVGSATATIAGLPATVEFAGAAPGLVAGVCQFNVRVPTPQAGQSISGAQQIVVSINGVSSPQGPTINIQ